MPDDIPENYWRISVKALILDDERKRFLICLEDNGCWELPGGGLDWGETPEECLRREVKEEMGLDVIYVSKNPCYFMHGKNMKGSWSINIVYEVKVKDFNFIKSEECQEIKFVSSEEIKTVNAFRNVVKIAEAFNPSNHKN